MRSTAHYNLRSPTPLCLCANRKSVDNRTSVYLWRADSTDEGRRRPSSTPFPPPSPPQPLSPPPSILAAMADSLAAPSSRTRHTEPCIFGRRIETGFVSPPTVSSFSRAQLYQQIRANRSVNGSLAHASYKNIKCAAQRIDLIAASVSSPPRDCCRGRRCCGAVAAVVRHRSPATVVPSSAVVVVLAVFPD